MDTEWIIDDIVVHLLALAAAVPGLPTEALSPLGQSADKLQPTLSSLHYAAKQLSDSLSDQSAFVQADTEWSERMERHKRRGGALRASLGEIRHSYAIQPLLDQLRMEEPPAPAGERLALQRLQHLFRYALQYPSEFAKQHDLLRWLANSVGEDWGGGTPK